MPNHKTCTDAQNKKTRTVLFLIYEHGLPNRQKTQQDIK